MSYFAAPSWSIPNRAIPERSLPGWVLSIYSHGTVYAIATNREILGIVKRDIIGSSIRLQDIVSLNRLTEINTEDVRFIMTDIDSKNRMKIISAINKNREVKYKEVDSEAIGKSRVTSLLSEARITGVQ